MNKNERLKRKNKKWLDKYGVSYTDCLGKRTKKERYKTIYFWKMLAYCKGYKWTYLFLGLFGLLIAGIALLEPIFLQKTLDSITLSNFEYALWCALGYCIMIIIIRMFNWIYRLVSEKTYHKLAKDIRLKLSSSICNTKISKFDSIPTGNIINRVGYDVMNYSAAVSNALEDLTSCFLCLAYTTYAIFINIWLGLLLVLIGLTSYIIKQIYNKYYNGIYERRYGFVHDSSTSIFNETVRGVRDIKSLNIKENLRNKIDVSSNYIMNQGYDVTKKSQLFSTITKVVHAILLFAFFAISIYFMSIGQLAISVFVVLFIYRTNIFDLFNNLINVKENIRSGEITGERIYEIFDDNSYPKETFGTKKLKKVKGEIEFKDVDFGYKEDKLLFEKLNLKILPNECVGFVGKSGQGKSTIINLIPKLYEVNSGKILLDGVDINKLTEESLRDNICVVSQTPYIFNYSIKENMQFAKADASDEEIEEVCKKAYLSEFIESLPEKYETKIGEGGVQLSGGQRQRLAIARALLKNSKIILFDEATSALDNESQEKIKQAIDDMKKEKTIIIVAHRLTTVKDCDKIFVLDKHKIVGEGTHEQLMQTCEEYKNLYHNEKA